ITPEEGEDGHPLIQTDVDLIFDGEVEKHVHPERLGGERSHPADLLTKGRRRAKLRLQDAEAASVAYRGDKLRSGEVGSHWSSDDGVLDPQQLAEISSHVHRVGG